MNDTPYRVDLAELQDLIDEAKRLDTQIEARVDAIRRQVEQLHVQWTGAAATGHQQFVDRWTTDTAAMREALTTLQAALTRAHGNYSGAVDVNKEMWP
ncbi:WXG100 family type VII secretion target [Nocardia sp. NEAU-G5]|uniref:ESAT-6-like protein n=1 Tax=Nocardia albiluteola TaxID=2842303 RepID=A0ABS6AYP8_9NOCA|nr:WXG100 family type VII secretion target [Nocardia albiluteola]MBU3063129.1 WXG100 family type VII secretion target [Nocardia albiluteola]